jgi:type I restriction enzyme, S subunit
MSWAEVTLNEICDTQYGYTASAMDEPVGPKFLRITDIVSDTIDWSSVPYCPINENDLEKYLLRKGDIVIARTGATTGYAKLIRENENKAVFASYLVRLKLNQEVAYPGFVGRLLESHVYKTFVDGIKGGAAQPNANAKTLTLFKFSLPDMLTQKNIAEVLSSYDDLIENNKRRIELLEDSARQLYKEWFVRFLFPGHEHVEITDGVPEGWTNTTAFEVVDVLSGGTPKTSNPEFWDGDIPFFTPKDATSSIYAKKTIKTLTESGLNSCSSGFFPKDTLFITARGTVGKLNLAQVPMAMNQSCYALVGKKPLTQFFLYFALGAGIQQVKSRAVGAVFDAVIKDTFKVIPFTVPPQNLIDQFTGYVSPTVKQIDLLTRKNENLAKSRDLLLPKLMSGEIAV